MRRLLCLSAGLLLTIGTLSLLGCPASAPADKAADAQTGAPADQGTAAETPTEDISATDEKSGTPLNLHSAKDDLDGYTNSGEEVARGSADATPVHTDESGPAPSLEAVEKYVSRMLYPGSTYVTGQGPESSGKVIIAMTQANVPASTVRTHFEGRGARTLNSTGDGQNLTVSMELIDHPQGVKVQIEISQLGSASGSCLINYTAYPIPTGPKPEDGAARPAMPGNG